MFETGWKAKSKTTTQKTARGSAPQQLQERIAKKAYELFEKRGRTPGNEVADWLEAEKLVRAGKA